LYDRTETGTASHAYQVPGSLIELSAIRSTNKSKHINVAAARLQNVSGQVKVDDVRGVWPAARALGTWTGAWWRAKTLSGSKHSIAQQCTGLEDWGHWACLHAQGTQDYVPYSCLLQGSHQL
jgi:hypothetical protein